MRKFCAMFVKLNIDDLSWNVFPCFKYWFCGGCWIVRASAAPIDGANRLNARLWIWRLAFCYEICISWRIASSGWIWSGALFLSLHSQTSQQKSLVAHVSLKAPHMYFRVHCRIFCTLFLLVMLVMNQFWLYMLCWLVSNFDLLISAPLCSSILWLT